MILALLGGMSTGWGDEGSVWIHERALAGVPTVGPEGCAVAEVACLSMQGDPGQDALCGLS